MARIALRRGRDVCCRLGHGIDGDERTTVAGIALAGEAGVIHGCRSKAYKSVDVTGIALRDSRNMPRLWLTQRVDSSKGAVMAG